LAKGNTAEPAYTAPRKHNLWFEFTREMVCIHLTKKRNSRHKNVNIILYIIFCKPSDKNPKWKPEPEAFGHKRPTTNLS